ncbi:hypothetical protein ACOME3_004009 [Neoechinorhynchus agilis]
MTSRDEEINNLGKSFVQSYYSIFDGPNRENLLQLYVPDNESSQLSFEGTICRGQDAILNKIKTFTFKTVSHSITSCDISSTLESGIFIMVTGRLKADNDLPLDFAQSFLLKCTPDGRWYVVNDFFRLIVHNTI